ncbi:MULTISPECIES: carbohydrate ABC transporter permease [Paenibacillus]|uniref:Sugar ABC transporter permease n=1 Tax=Paenibacillus lignilyticus TaxID=1172615 RepID=A0ABS5CKH5_9BACL|nr:MULTISPECIES: sugar ABC transporter permease [Paenibacillus]MBP3966373.1 sugar ABC transporter permease [Paenibacillus lignilyticus]SFT20300.1 raffinose/stachyose/melibiose transport system permease protein [Paenibacillus sp. BC26]
MRKYLGNKTAILLFILPALLLYTIVVFYPVVQVFYRSLLDWDGLTEGKFIFLDNYTRLFHDRIFRTSVYNGAVFAAVIAVVQIVIGTLLAFAVAEIAMRGRKFVRISVFIPVVLSITVVCQLWLAMYNGEYGLLNKLFEALGLSYRQDWLTDEKTAIFALAAVNAWQYMGYHFALLLAAVKSVPEHYMEAARIDGANKLQAHARITIPLLSETYKFCLVLALTGGLNAFANMFIMTGGGPGTTTYTLTYMMYRSAFRVGEFGYGSASAAFLVMECLVITLLINRLIARDPIVY